MTCRDMKGSTIPIDSEVLNQSLTDIARTPADYETEEKSPLKFYDIKGNSFKDTLVPKETALSALKISNETLKDFTTDYRLEKVKPKYRGYNRSGAILFHNINQVDVQNQRTPRSCDKLRVSKSTLSRTKKDHSTLSVQKPRPYD